MSSDDFQTKYSSVMETMLKGAIAETTKLFETMVDELKVEISGMKKENEDLKLRCIQFESARNPPTVLTGGSESRHGPTDGSEKRDRAVQCDLVPIRTILVEQCQSLRHSPLQEQQGRCEPMAYSLQDHTYGEGTTQMAFILVKQEDSYDVSAQHSVVKQEETEALVCGLVLNDKAGSPPACATGNEGIQLMESGLQGAQIQLSELEHSQVFSLAAIKDSVEEESEFSRKEELVAPEKTPLVVAQCQSPLEKVQPLVEPLQCQREDNKVSASEPANVSPQLQPPPPNPSEKGEACEAAEKRRTRKEELVTPEKAPLVVSQCQSQVEPLEKEQPLVKPQQCQREDNKVSVSEPANVSPQLQLSPPTPPKKGEMCEATKKIRTRKEELVTPEKTPLVVAQCQSPLEKVQPLVEPQQCPREDNKVSVNEPANVSPQLQPPRNEEMCEPLKSAEGTINRRTRKEKLVTPENTPLVVAQCQSQVEPLEKEQLLVKPQQCQRQANKVSVSEPANVSPQLQQSPATPPKKGEMCEALKSGEANKKRRTRKEKLVTPENTQLVVAQSQSHVEPLAKVQPMVKPQQCQRQANKVSVSEPANVSPQLQPSPPTPPKEVETCEALSVEPPKKRRGRPPKKNRRLQPPGKGIVSPAVPEASLSKLCSSEIGKASESQPPSTEIEDDAIGAPSTPSLANVTMDAATVQTRERRTSVTLQDALLLVEAMNQSIIKGVLTSPQRIATPIQTQCSPGVGTLATVDEVPAETAQPTTEKVPGPSGTSDAASTTKPQALIKIIIPKQHLTVKPSLTTTTTSLTHAVKTSVQSLQRSRPLITLVAPIKPGMAVSHKLIAMPRLESSLTRQKVAALSPTQLPTVVSTVVAAQKNRLPGAALGSTSLPSVSQKATRIAPGNSITMVSSQSTTTTTTSSDLQSGTLPHPKITIIIPRQMPALGPSKPQKTIVLIARQESTESAAAAAPVASSAQSITPSQEVSISVDAQTVLDEVAAISSQKRHQTLILVELTKQTAPVSEPVNASSETCSGSNVSVRPTVPTSMSPMVALTAVVRLTRLPFPVSPKDAVLVSRLPPARYLESRSVSKPSSAVLSTPAPETLVLDGGSTDGGPSTPSELWSAVVENSPVAISESEPPAGEPTADEGMMSIAAQDCASPPDPPMEERESSGLIQLTDITTKDTADPYLQMTKAQFLAQLAVTPVPQDPKKVSSDNSELNATTAETSTSEKKRLQKKSLVAQLRSHLKTRLQARTRKTNSDLCTAAETPTVNPQISPPENESPKNIEATVSLCETVEPIPISPKDPGDVTSPMKTAKSPTAVSPRRSGLRGADARPKTTSKEPSLISSRRLKATRKSAPVTPMRSISGAHVVASKTKKSTSVIPIAKAKRGRPKKTTSTSVSPSRSNSIKESASLKRPESSLSPRRSSSIKERASLKRTKPSSVSPRRSSSNKESTTPKKTKSTSASPRRSSAKNARTISVRPRWISSTKDGTSPKSAKATSLSPRRTSLSTDGVIPKKAKSIVGQETPKLSKKGTSPKGSIDKSMFCRRRCTLPKDGSSSKQNNREANALAARAPTQDSPSETSSPNVNWPELAQNGIGPKKTRESTPTKKPRLGQDATGPKRKLMAGDAKRLTKAAKAQMLAKLQNGATAESREAMRKCTARAVWTPPRLPARKPPPPPPPAARQRETASPFVADHTLVFPASVSLLPIPVKGPTVISPLQPLSVIGRRLLKNQCGECGRVLSSLAALESHVSLHTGRRPFSCTLCGKRFPDSKGLKRHGRVHRNGRIHICQQCGKGFVYRFGLTKHLRMVHRKLKPFICQICHGAYFTRRDMEAHIRMHTGEKPFHCNLCEKKFARRVELNMHLRWHNGEKRHWCPFCGKGFLDFNNLKRHKYIHTGEKPHACPHCPKSFTQSGHLKKHVKTVHKIL